MTTGAKAAGRLDKADFIYHATDNEYECPAGQRLIWRFSRIESGLNLHKYWRSHCQQCDIKAQCTPGEQLCIRRQTVGHPFGTLKAWMGSTHFLTKTLDRVSTEMSLHILAYNLKRVMNLLGTTTLMEAMVV